MKFLVPMARISLEDCQRMAAAFAQHHCSTREAGQLYAAWRDGSPLVRERLLAAPELFFKTTRQPPHSDSTAAALERDMEMVGAVLRRARQRLRVALPEMSGAQQQDLQRQLETAQLDRMTDQIGKENPAVHVEPRPTNHDSGTAHPGSEQTRDCAHLGDLAPQCAQSAALANGRGSGNRASRESRTLPATHPGSIQHVQGESRASP
jgi:hypothetical protein